MKREVKEGVDKPRVVLWVRLQLHRLAGLLQVKLAQRSYAWQKRALVCYCIVALGVSAAVSYWSLVHPVTAQIKVAPIRLLPALPPTVQAPKISEEEFRNIHRWRVQLDSLNAVNQQRKNVMKFPRAGTLRDTLFYLENIYHQQFK